VSEPWSLCHPHQSLNKSSSAVVVGVAEPPAAAEAGDGLLSLLLVLSLALPRALALSLAK
jgi:hypothetical protein